MTLPALTHPDATINTAAIDPLDLCSIVMVIALPLAATIMALIAIPKLRARSQNAADAPDPSRDDGSGPTHPDTPADARGDSPAASVGGRQTSDRGERSDRHERIAAWLLVGGIAFLTCTFAIALTFAPWETWTSSTDGTPATLATIPIVVALVATLALLVAIPRLSPDRACATGGLVPLPFLGATTVFILGATTVFIEMYRERVPDAMFLECVLIYPAAMYLTGAVIVVVSARSGSKRPRSTARPR